MFKEKYDLHSFKIASQGICQLHIKRKYSNFIVKIPDKHHLKQW